MWAQPLWLGVENLCSDLTATALIWVGKQEKESLVKTIFESHEAFVCVCLKTQNIFIFSVLFWEHEK